jgi:hypothetical protein
VSMEKSAFFFIYDRRVVYRHGYCRETTFQTAPGDDLKHVQSGALIRGCLDGTGD